MAKKHSKWFTAWKRKFELDSCKYLARQWAFGYVSTKSLINALRKYERLVKA